MYHNITNIASRHVYQHQLIPKKHWPYKGIKVAGWTEKTIYTLHRHVQSRTEFWHTSLWVEMSSTIYVLRSAIHTYNADFCTGLLWWLKFSSKSYQQPFKNLLAAGAMPRCNWKSYNAPHALRVRTRPIKIVIHRSLNKVFGLIKVNNNIIMSRQFLACRNMENIRRV